MEDYKTLYEQRIERAKEVYNRKDATDGEKITLETIFPELKESEDERIRKAILELVKQSSHILNPMNQKSMIAWLEKQGGITDKIIKRAKTEKQRVILTESDGNANIDWDCRSIYDVEALLCYGLEYIRNAEANKQSDKLEKQGEQKSTWSEEDEEIFDAIIADIQFTQKAHIHEVNQVVYEREIDWLKSLKERMKGE